MRKFLLWFLWLLVGNPLAAQRVVAVGDIHGAYDPFVAILRQVALIDEDRDWIGKDATLVVTGDFLDRGARVLQVIELLMELEHQARDSGGRVIVLLGNHEVMNLLGDWRDVPASAFADLQDKRSEVRRNFLLQEHRGVLRRLSGDRRLKLTEEQKERFLAAHPPGFVEYGSAFAPDSRYGRWLRTLATAARVGDGIFLHGGISPLLQGMSLEEINRRVEREIRTWDRCREWLIEDASIHSGASFREVVTQARAQEELPELPADCREVARIQDSFLVHSDGPFWFRGYAAWSEDEGSRLILPILEGLGAGYLVVGHTPFPKGGIQMRFAGRVFLIDSGMLEEVYGGRPSALVIEATRTMAVTLGQTRVLLDRAAERIQTPESER